MAKQTESAEVVVIGAGPAGYVCAIRLAQLGKKVTVIERDKLGGVCLNVGCIPSKAMIHAANTYEKITKASVMGITARNVDLDFSKLLSWKDSVVGKLTSGVATLLKAYGCKVIKGDASFVSPHALHVKGTDGVDLELSFTECVIATGSRPVEIPGFEFDQKTVIDSTGALSFDRIPQSLLCIGGGYIGLELGTVYAKLGTKVTVVEALPQLLSGVDSDLTRIVQKRLKELGVEVLVNTRAKTLKPDEKGVEVVIEEQGKDRKASFEKVLVTVGRRPNTDGLALEKAGLKTNAKGFLKVNAQLRTDVPTIFAIGDAAGPPLLAHKGSKEGIVAAEVIAGLRAVYDVQAMPAVVFTDPEIATVGLSESEARAQGLAVDVGLFPFAANGRALSVGDLEGFVKVISDRKSGRLLGVNIVGPEASNLIAEAALALEMGARVEDIALTVHAHPTLPEALMESAEAALGHAIHIVQKRRPSESVAQAQV